MELISRKQAIQLGLKRYFTGKPCKNGHTQERETKTGRCFDCIKVWNDSKKEYMSEYRKSYSKIDSVKNKRNLTTKTLRDKSTNLARNSMQVWSLRDIGIATELSACGGYVKKRMELVALLGRSMRSIDRIRNRFKQKAP